MRLTLYYAAPSHTTRATPVSTGMTRAPFNELRLIGHLLNGKNFAGLSAFAEGMPSIECHSNKICSPWNIFYSHFHVYLYSTDNE